MPTKMRPVKQTGGAPDGGREFQAAFDVSSIGMCQADPSTGRLLRVNRRFCQMVGATEAELVGRSFAEITHPDDRAANVDGVRRLASGEISEYRATKRYVRRDGRIIWADVAATLVRDGAGRALRTVAVVQDVTARKEAEEALRLAHRRLGTFVEEVPAPIAMLDRDLRYVATSRRWLREFGLGDIDLGGRHHYDVFPEIRASADWQAVHQRCLAGAVEQRDEDRVVRADGTETWLHWEVRPWHEGSGAIGGILIFAEDVTAHRREAAAHAEALARLRLALDASGAAVWGWDIEPNRLDDWSPQFREIYGFGHDVPATFDNWIERLHPDDRPAVLARLRGLLAGEPHGEWDAEFRIMHPARGQRWVRGLGRLFRDGSGRPVRMAGINLDVTPRKQRETALLESEAEARGRSEALARKVNERSAELARERARFEAIVGAAGEGIMTVGADGTIESVNPAMPGIFGHEASAMVGRNVTGLLPEWRPDGRMGDPQALLATFGTHKDGHRIPVELSVRRIDLEGERLYSAVLRDVSGRRRLETMLRERTEDAAQIHRLRIAGELAGVLAHQLNQPLTAIQAFADAADARLRRGTADPARIAQSFREIGEQAQRAAQIIRDLRRFLSRERSDMVAGDLNAIAARALDLMRTQARDVHVELSADLTPRLPPALVLESQIEQVLLVLLSNAIDAIAEGRQSRPAHGGPAGTVTVRTETSEKPGGLTVTVRDSGPGFDANALPRLFEPLYTTKAHGVGLGLTIARSIVEAHGGRIWAEPGKGGCIRFTLSVAS